LARKKIFKGKIFSVFTSDKMLPNGIKARFEEVDHPGASLIVPFISDKIVFIRQYRGVIGRYIWELPAGLINRGETPYACAKREITEETGYHVRNLKKVGMIYTSPGFCNEKIHLFTADCVEKKPPKLDEDEVLMVKLFSKREVARMFAAGRICDSKTAAALAFCGII
jgi:ADP-ribose pyrophosphatase